MLTSSNLVDGRAEVMRQALTAELKGKVKHQTGTAEWIDLGLRAQEEQLSVAAMARKVNRRTREPTAAELLELTKRRTQLRRLIDRFLSEAPVYLPRPSRPMPGGSDNDNPAEDNIDEEVSDLSPLEERIFNGLVEDPDMGSEWDNTTVAGDGEGDFGFDDQHSEDQRHSNVGDGMPPECILLPLPSSFTAAYRRTMGWLSQASVELFLRAGRLRDHLARL